ncbi:hypothetical protein IID62_11750 [candidate division KSB1 bacterium]|nr:hypothetical protein [candidate division KSB1 bacterium]
MKQKTILILSAATVAILFACGSTHEFYSVEIVDGVRTVHNIKPLWGDEPKIQLELVQVIGGLDAEDENFQLYRPYDIAIDHDGNRYLLDSGNNRVQKFDLNWNYVSSFGQKGQGPGDISFARQLQFDIDGDLHVLESGNSRVQVFSTDSKSIRIYKSGGFRNEFSLLNSGLIAGNGYLGGLQTLSREQRLNLQDVDFPNLYIYDQKGSIIRKIGKERKYEARGMKALGNYSSVTFDREDNLYIAFGGARNDDIAWSSAPTNYTNLTSTITGGGTDDGASVGTARRELASDSDNPGTFGLAGNERTRGATLVIRPAAAVAGVLDLIMAPYIPA